MLSPWKPGCFFSTLAWWVSVNPTEQLSWTISSFTRPLFLTNCWIDCHQVWRTTVCPPWHLAHTCRHAYISIQLNSWSSWRESSFLKRMASFISSNNLVFSYLNPHWLAGFLHDWASYNLNPRPPSLMLLKHLNTTLMMVYPVQIQILNGISAQSASVK